MMKMTKLLAVVLALVMMLCVAVPVSAAGSEFDVAITSNMAKVTYGDTVTFTVAVENITASGGLLSVDIPLRFDSAVFEYVGVEEVFPTVWQNPQSFSYSEDKNGLLWLRVLEDSGYFSSAYGCSENRAICFKVTLRVKENAVLGASTVTTAGDGGFEVPCGTCADGQCTVTYGTGGSCTVNITDETNKLGDVNGDGNTDNTDAAIILRYDAGLIELSENQLKAADVNGSGYADNVDAARILQYDAGLIDQL